MPKIILDTERLQKIAAMRRAANEAGMTYGYESGSALVAAQVFDTAISAMPETVRQAPSAKAIKYFRDGLTVKTHYDPAKRANKRLVRALHRHGPLLADPLALFVASTQVCTPKINPARVLYRIARPDVVSSMDAP